MIGRTNRWMAWVPPVGVVLGACGDEAPSGPDDEEVAALTVDASEGWYSYDPRTHAVSASPESVWKVRTAGRPGSSWRRSRCRWSSGSRS